MHGLYLSLLFGVTRQSKIEPTRFHTENRFDAYKYIPMFTHRSFHMYKRNVSGRGMEISHSPDKPAPAHSFQGIYFSSASADRKSGLGGSVSPPLRTEERICN